MSDESKVTPMRPRDGEKREVNADMRCPHCEMDPVTVGMRTTAIPPPPMIAKMYLVTFGCTNPECRKVLNTQLCTPQMLEVLVGKPTLYV